MEKPTEVDYKEIQGKKYAIADVYIDLEACGGPYQALNGTRSVGMHVRSRTTGVTIFEAEWCVSALAGIDCPVQVQEFWFKPANKDEWDAICAKEKPRLEVLNEIRTVVQDAVKNGWFIHVLARPATYDFRELTALFQTAGIEILSRRPDFANKEMSPQQILSQICAPFDLREPVPAYFNPRNMMASPFGFGGATQVTDMGQQINGAALMVGNHNGVDFRKLLIKVLGRELTHNGLQDARDQADVWCHFKKLVETGTPEQIREFLQ
jgi:hypothetical protein